MATAIDIRGTEQGGDILTTEALAFVAELQRTFGRTITDLMERRALRESRLGVLADTRHLLARGTAPYFYLPKLESHLEARLWNVVFLHAERALGLQQGTIKATVLIETLPAAFEMNEILYELREHSAGLNCGRWDYIFSFIK